VDAVSGETITYKYDALKRLSSATAQNWGETYTYDGYGNLTQMSPTGTAGAPALSVTVALDANGDPTNQISATGVAYDNNGNQTAGFGGLSLTYDAANRLSAVAGSQSAAYAYDTDNRRIYSRDASGNETIYFYGVDGKKQATYTSTIVANSGEPYIQLTVKSINLYFLGKLIIAEGYDVSTDRLGSVRNGSQTGYEAQYPYGVEYTTTANDREKYATYTRDSVTGLDYAVNRYYSSQWGRFLSPDPYAATASPANPQTWNRYAYVAGDPVNRTDVFGLDGDPGLTGICGNVSGLIFTALLTGPPGSCSSAAAAAASQGMAPSPDPLGGWTSDAPNCGFGYGTVCIPYPVGPAAPPPASPPSPPSCEVMVGYAPVQQAPAGYHTFLYVDTLFGWMVADGGPAQTPRVVLGGGGGVSFSGYGNLITNVSPTGLYNENTNPESNIYWESPESCSLVMALWGDAQSLSNLVPYTPVAPGTNWYNSNSFTYTVVQDFALPVPAPPVWAPGWGNYIPH
jgi:RHS repeat-associated protein